MVVMHGIEGWDDMVHETLMMHQVHGSFTFLILVGFGNTLMTHDDVCWRYPLILILVLVLVLVLVELGKDIKSKSAIMSVTPPTPIHY